MIVNRCGAILAAALILCVLTAIVPVAVAETPQVHTTGVLAGMPVLVGAIPCAFPLVQQPETLRILSTAYGTIPYTDVYVWQQYEQMTGVHVDWTTVDKTKRAQAVYDALSMGRPYDLILRCKLSSPRLTKYGEQGLLLDLAQDDLLARYAPNCWAYLQAHPETLASITNPDGKIYSLPQVNSGAELRVGIKLFINKRWLERVHMDVPTTTEALYRVLGAFKAQDANGNGDPSDEIPLCSPDWASTRMALNGAFGLGNRGMHDELVDCDEASGKVRLIAGADGYRDLLAYCQTLYGEGLIDHNQFTMDLDYLVGYIKDDRVGMFANTNLAFLPAAALEDWIAVEEALEGPNGDKLWSPVRANFHSTGAAAIPATCKNPALVLRWLDYFWTDEGTLFYHMGTEGETFVKTEAGFAYMPFVDAQMASENKSFDDIVARISPYPGGSNPTVEIAPYFMGGEMAPIPAEAARKLFAYGPSVYWPSFTFTTAENEALDAVRTDLTKYCSQMEEDFVTGRRSLSTWPAYLAQLERLQAPQLLAVYQAALDRYEGFLAARG